MYVVIGANGYLGSYFIKNIIEATDEPVVAVARHPGMDWGNRVKWVSCDITNPNDAILLNQTVLKKNLSNKILFLAAYHHPDLVEKNPRLAWDTNVTSLSRFLNLADNVSHFYYPSSDSVYGEGDLTKRFKEDDIPCPVNRYGVQKTVAEKLVIAYGYNVVRFPFLIAPSLLPNKKHFYDVIVESLQANKPFEMFADSYRSTLNFDTAAKLTIELIESKKQIPQVMNVCGDKAYSKYEVGLLIAEKLHCSFDLIVPISIDNASGIFNAKRANSTVLDNTLLKKIMGYDYIPLVL